MAGDALDDIFKFDKFDLSKVRTEVKSTVDSLKSMESGAQEATDSMEEISKRVSKLSFNQPVSEIKELQQTLKLVLTAKGLGTNVIDDEIKRLTTTASGLKSLLQKMKAQGGLLEGKELEANLKSIKAIEVEIQKLSDVERNAKKQQTENAKTTRQEFMELKKASGEMTNEQLRQSAKLKDAIGDQQQQMRILASDTKALDFGLAAIGLAANGYQAVTGAMQLFGIENEDVMKGIQKLQAIMAITNSLREIQNALLAEGTLRTLLQSGAVTTLTASEVALATATEGATVANEGFALSLSATGIGAIVVAIGLAVAAWMAYRNEQEKTAESVRLFNLQQKEMIEFNKQVATNASKESANLRVLKAAIEDTNLPMAKRLDAIKEIKKEFPTYFSSLSNEALLAGKVGDAYDKAANAIIRKAKAEVAQDKIKKFVEQQLDAEIKIQEKIAEFQKKYASAKTTTTRFDGGDGKTFTQVFSAEDEKLRLKKVLENELKPLIAAKMEAQNSIDDYIRIAVDNTDSFTNPEKAKNVKAATIASVKDATAAKKEPEVISEDAKAKAIFEITTAINDFKEKARAIDLANLADYNAKALEEINNSEQLQLDAVADSYTKLIFKIREDKKKGLIDADQEQKQIDDVGVAVNNLFDKINNDADAKRKNLLFKVFEDSLKGIDEEIKILQAATTTRQEIETQQAQQQYKDGAISYDKYQKVLTEISKKYALARLKDEEAAILARLTALRGKKLEGGLNTEQSKSINSEILNLETQLSQNQTDQGAQGIANGKDAKDKGLEAFDKNVKAYMSLADAALTAINTIIAAENRLLDTQISNQEKRVDAATKLADKGNKSYVELEQQKLTKLLQQKEANAKRQLQIDSALQASQILVAVAGAAAKIAGADGNKFEVIAGIATIIGALASGAALVKSYSDNSPRLAEGTDSFGRKDFRKGTDRITTGAGGVDRVPAWLNYGEAVISTPEAIKYQPLIKAIRRNDLSGIQRNLYADFPPMSKFVINNEGQITKADIDELKEAIAGIKMNVNLDSEGFTAQLQTLISKKSKYSNV